MGFFRRADEINSYLSLEKHTASDMFLYGTGTVLLVV